MNILIAGITSDIGQYICNKYIEKGYSVFGTYRKLDNNGIRKKIELGGGKLFYCDYSDRESVTECIKKITDAKIIWDVFISAIGIMDPIEKFIDVDIDKWEKNIYVNTISQMRFLRGVLCLRSESASVYFMTSKGINDTFPDHSAYCISKIILVKMCELLDDEIDNCKFIAFNPGFINTKIIRQEKNEILNHNDDYNNSLDRVWRFIEWSYSQSKRVVSGKNFFIKYDLWENDDILEILTNKNVYKLRRCGDTWFME